MRRGGCAARSSINVNPQIFNLQNNIKLAYRLKMQSFFSRLKGKDGSSRLSKTKKNALQAVVSQPPPKPVWEDAWARKTVEPEEVQELLKQCTVELKARGMSNWQLPLCLNSCIGAQDTGYFKNIGAG